MKAYVYHDGAVWWEIRLLLDVMLERKGCLQVSRWLQQYQASLERILGIIGTCAGAETKPSRFLADILGGPIANDIHIRQEWCISTEMFFCVY